MMHYILLVSQGQDREFISIMNSNIGLYTVQIIVNKVNINQLSLIFLLFYYLLFWYNLFIYNFEPTMTSIIMWYSLYLVTERVVRER